MTSLKKNYLLSNSLLFSLLNVYYIYYISEFSFFITIYKWHQLDIIRFYSYYSKGFQVFFVN